MSQDHNSRTGLLRRFSGGPLADSADAPSDPGPRLSPYEFHTSKGVATSLFAILGALRWGAVMVGLVFAVPQAVGEEEIALVGTVAIAIFLTSWRTVSPLRLGEPALSSKVVALSDVAIFSAAIALRGGFTNPFVGSLFVAVAIVALGWGLSLGIGAAGTAVAVTSVLTFVIEPNSFDIPSPLAIFALLGSAVLPGVLLDRMLESEGRRQTLADEHSQLSQAYELLAALNDLTRSLPASLDQEDVISHARKELVDTFDAKRIAILAYEEGTYFTLLQDGLGLAPEMEESELPSPLSLCSNSPEPVRIADLEAEAGRQGSGLYIRLVVDHRDTGLLAVEHEQSGRYNQHDAELLRGIAEVLGLTLANARSFKKLRSLAAAEERSRIARDLHDRLGQYLTYIALELERINSEEPSAALKQLYEDVQSAVAEFRDTLLELRAAVTDDRPLAVVLDEVVERFAARSGLEVSLQISDRSARLPARVENELLRIVQEALTNIGKHAKASNVHISWVVTDRSGELRIQDDGRGFNPSHGIRGSAYGLVGMRERAASVGAVLSVASEEGMGTSISVKSNQHPNR